MSIQSNKILKILPFMLITLGVLLLITSCPKLIDPAAKFIGAWVNVEPHHDELVIHKVNDCYILEAIEANGKTTSIPMAYENGTLRGHMGPADFVIYLDGQGYLIVTGSNWFETSQMKCRRK